MDLMRKYSTQDQDALVTMEREWDESASVSDDVESNDQSVTTSAFYEEEDRDAALLIKPVDTDTTVEEDDNICEEEEPSKNEPFAIKKSSESEDLVEPFARMEPEESLQEKDGKANPTEDVDHNASCKELHVAQLPKENHRSMWGLIHRHMIPDESTELDSEVSRGVDEENDKDEGNKTCPAESSDSFSSFSESDLMTTNQDSDNQETEARKLLAIKLVREAIERILLQEVQDQSSDNQSSVTSEVCTDEDFKESDTKNEEHDKASESDERNITGENTGSPEKQKKGHVTSEAEKKAPKNWSNLKRWILLQRFIKELEKLRKFNPRKPRFLQPEPDPEAEKVNLKHQIEDERKSAEEWMLDFALQKAINKRNSVLYQKLDEVTSTSSDKASVEGKAKQELKENGHTKLEPEAQIDEKEACGDSNDSQKGTSFATSNAGNDSDETQENDMIVHSEDNDGTYRKQANKQKHVSMWQMISQHILSDVVSKVGNELLDGTDDEHMITKLTPAKRTRVAMLVAAFETVVPLPEFDEMDQTLPSLVAWASDLSRGIKVGNVGLFFMAGLGELISGLPLSKHRVGSHGPNESRSRLLEDDTPYGSSNKQSGVLSISRSLKRRWLELLKDYDMSVLNHSGKAIVVANSLSRLSMGSVAFVDDNSSPVVIDNESVAIDNESVATDDQSDAIDKQSDA
ncbi:hypothetical protein CQW23_13977 [Capsicum baccatum]|uniref:Calmodulin-binding domain-containing protein n=1 Tax=Capsicum baccatum TaxID=33114 RepID=A0A2G2WI25_CAPBA|nr:hypothetical protein CQW23_13977 [Capsicum baccatum]